MTYGNLWDVPYWHGVIVTSSSAWPSGHVTGPKIRSHVTWVVLCGVVDWAQRALWIIARGHGDQPAVCATTAVVRRTGESRAVLCGSGDDCAAIYLAERQQQREEQHVYHHAAGARATSAGVLYVDGDAARRAARARRASRVHMR